MGRYLFVAVTLLELTVCFPGAVAHGNISAAVGQESVVLPCLVPRDRQVHSLEWTHRSHVLLVYKKGKVQDGYEHPVYTDRVQLEDPQHRSGVFSLRLKNITFKDTGIYECFILYSDSVESQFINLEVTEQEQDTTSVWTNIEKTLRKQRGLGIGLTLALILAIGLVFALKNSRHVNLKLFKQLHFHFCLEKPRSRKRVISCSSTNSSSGSEGSTKALIHIHGDLPIKADLAAPHRPVPDPLPPFSHPSLPSSSPTSTLTRGSSDSALSGSDLEMENPKPGAHVSCPNVCAVV